MRKVLILGAGAGGTIVANMLRNELKESDWNITTIDRDERHHYQAGYLFIPFGIYGESDVLKPVGTWGLLGALSDPKVKDGMGVVMEMTRGLAHLKA